MGRFSLILVVGFAIIAGSLRMNQSRVAREAQTLSNERYIRAAARNATNSAINYCLYQIAQDFDWRDGLDNQNFGCGSASANIVDSSTDTSLSVNEVLISATGFYGGESANAVVKVSKTPFSEFAYFTDFEPLIYFITGDTINGPIHTNGQFHIWGDPVFYGLVSMVATNYYGWGDPEFKAGTNFGAARIELPVDLSILEDRAENGGMQFESDVSLEFNDDGTFDWEVTHTERRRVRRGHRWVWETYEVVDSSGTADLSTLNGVIATDDGGDVHIQGTLNGQVTILSDGDIWIEDDIVYHQDPTTNPNTTDMLGLISRNNIYVADNPANRNNCVIHGTLMALDRSFTVENYRSGPPRGVLEIVGGLVQKERGPVGTFSRWGGRTGYQKKYTYDSRFMTTAPPYYPVFSKNTIISWYE